MLYWTKTIKKKYLVLEMTVHTKNCHRDTAPFVSQQRVSASPVQFVKKIRFPLQHSWISLFLCGRWSGPMPVTAFDRFERRKSGKIKWKKKLQGLMGIMGLNRIGGMIENAIIWRNRWLILPSISYGTINYCRQKESRHRLIYWLAVIQKDKIKCRDVP